MLEYRWPVARDLSIGLDRRTVNAPARCESLARRRCRSPDSPADRSIL